MKKHSNLFVPGIIMVGIVLRTPFAVLSIVLSDIADGLHISLSSLGLLTSLPLVMFALCSSFSPRLAQKFGLEKLFTLVLIALTIGSLIRIINLPFLYIGTVILGAAIALLNVLLPSIIQANQPHRIGLLTTLYISAMSLSITLASAVVVSIVNATSWQGLILVLTAVCLVAFLVWLPNTKYNHFLERKGKNQPIRALLKNKKVLALIAL